MISTRLSGSAKFGRPEDKTQKPTKSVKVQRSPSSALLTPPFHIFALFGSHMHRLGSAWHWNCDRSYCVFYGVAESGGAARGKPGERSFAWSRDGVWMHLALCTSRSWIFTDDGIGYLSDTFDDGAGVEGEGRSNRYFWNISPQKVEIVLNFG